MRGLVLATLILLGGDPEHVLFIGNLKLRRVVTAVGGAK